MFLFLQADTLYKLCLVYTFLFGKIIPTVLKPLSLVARVDPQHGLIFFFSVVADVLFYLSVCIEYVHSHGEFPTCYQDFPCVDMSHIVSIVLINNYVASTWLHLMIWIYLLGFTAWVHYKHY